MRSGWLRLASYNVHSWFGRGRRCDPDRAVAVLREIDADVVALQEARALCADRLTKPLAELCEASGYELLEGPTLSFGESSYGNALLSRIPVCDSETLDLTVARREPRGALAASLRCDGRALQVVSTHLGLRARERVLQTAKLLEWIGAEVASRPPDLLSLLGDLNEWRPRAAVLRRIDATFGRAAAPRTFPAVRPWLRLDRIWVLPRGAVRGRVRAHQSPHARAASDHLPVVVDVELPEPGEGWRRARRERDEPAR